MRPWLPLLPAWLLLILLTSASPATACDFVETPPPPARLYVWDFQSDQIVHEQDVWSRGLDGDCGLIKGVTLDGDRLASGDHIAFSEQSEAKSGIWLKDITDNKAPMLVREGAALYYDLDITDEQLLAYFRTDPSGMGHEREHHVHRIDLQEGDDKRLDIEVDWLGDPRVVDGKVIWTNVDRDHYTHRLNIYDGLQEQWIVQDARFSEIGLPDDTRLVQANGAWLILGTQDGDHWAYHQKEETLRNLGHKTRQGELLLDGDRLYSQQNHGDDLILRAIDLESGESVGEWRPPPKPVFRDAALEQPLMTLGQYSVSDEEWGDAPREPPEWVKEAEPFADPPLLPAEPDPFIEMIPGPTPLAPLVALTAFLIVRRPRRRPAALAAP